MKTEANIKVKGMHCSSCEKKIKGKLARLNGVEAVQPNLVDETVKVGFDSSKITKEEIGQELSLLGYPAKNSLQKGRGKHTLKNGIIYGLVPHIGCIGFIAASILGATIAVEFFKPLLMNPWFFHILVLLSIGFATLSSVFYLRKNGLLSLSGVKRKKKYLTTMYGSTVGINLVLFLAVFPMLANLDTGSFANPTGAVALAAGGSGQLAAGDSLIRLQVNIPCPGHAPLISGELKTIKGVTGVRFDFPNYFDVAFDSEKTLKQEILSLEVFEIYKASVASETIADSGTGTASLQGIKEVEEVSQQPSAPAGSCGGSCGGSSCGGSSGGGCGCGG